VLALALLQGVAVFLGLALAFLTFLNARATGPAFLLARRDD